MSKDNPPPIENHRTTHLIKPSDDPFRASGDPFPQAPDDPNAPPWEKGEFKKRVLAAGFPGSPGSDTAFLAALYKFAGGKVEEPPKHK